MAAFVFRRRLSPRVFKPGVRARAVRSCAIFGEGGGFALPSRLRAPPLSRVVTAVLTPVAGNGEDDDGDSDVVCSLFVCSFFSLGVEQGFSGGWRGRFLGRVGNTSALSDVSGVGREKGSLGLSTLKHLIL